MVPEKLADRRMDHSGNGRSRGGNRGTIAEKYLKITDNAWPIPLIFNRMSRGVIFFEKLQIISK
jgi:hypothetical protein